MGGSMASSCRSFVALGRLLLWFKEVCTFPHFPPRGRGHTLELAGPQDPSPPGGIPSLPCSNPRHLPPTLSSRNCFSFSLFLRKLNYETTNNTGLVT